MWYDNTILITTTFLKTVCFIMSTYDIVIYINTTLIGKYVFECNRFRYLYMNAAFIQVNKTNFTVTILKYDM